MKQSKLLLVLVLICVATLAVSPAGVVAQEPKGKLGLGLIPSEGDFPKFDASRFATRLAALPPLVDLAAGLPPVGNQGFQGSCVGWTVAYYYKTFQERQERGWDVTNTAHQFSAAWIYNQRTTTDCTRDLGMSYYNGFQILRDRGAAPVSSFPYSPSDSCTQPPQAVRDAAYPYRAKSFENIFAGRGNANLATLKGLLAEGKPFAIALPVYSSFYRVTYANPIVPRHADGEAYYGGHAMLVVGYDDALGGFKAVNSWGSGWGRDGFAYLAYDFVQYDAWEAWSMEDHVEATQPTTVNVPLRVGWNLIALPVEPTTTNVPDLFAAVASDIAEVYRWETGKQAWQRYVPSLPSFAQSLGQMNATDGLWLRVERATSLSVTGNVSAARDVRLINGWNLVRYPGTTAKPVGQAMTSLAGKCTRIAGYNGEWQYYDVSNPGGSTLQLLEPGKAYWIRVSESCTWDAN